MSARGDVVAVLDGLVVEVDGEPMTVVAFPHVPDSMQALTAWPVWAFTTWRTKCIAEETFQVLVTLPGGVPDAWSTYGDAVTGPIRDALSKLGGVMRCEPVAVPSINGGATIPALAFTLVT